MKLSKYAMLAALLLLDAVGGIPSSASAESQSLSAKSARCSVYDPRPKCTEDYRNATRKRFGLPTLKKIHQRNGYAGLKNELIVATVSLKLGGGVALILQRNRNGTPTVEIRQMLRRERLSEPKPISVKIPETTWDIIIAKEKSLNLVYATDEILLCGATFTVERVDEKGNIRAPVGDSCGNEPRGVFFEAFAQVALAQLPHCAALYPEGYNATLDRLTTCFALSGEQMVAAELFNQLDSDDFWSTMGNVDPSTMRPLFEDKMKFLWPGIPLIADAETAAEFWVGDWLYSVDLQYDKFDAETYDRVLVTGSVLVHRPEGEGDVQRRTGSFTAIWRRGTDGKFRMHRFEHSGRSSLDPWRSYGALLVTGSNVLSV